MPFLMFSNTTDTENLTNNLDDQNEGQPIKIKKSSGNLDDKHEGRPKKAVTTTS